MLISKSSYSRFAALTRKREARQAIAEAAREYAGQLGLQMRFLSPGDHPSLPAKSSFKYDNDFRPFTRALERGEKVGVAVAELSAAIIAYVLLETPNQSGWTVQSLDVRTKSKRSEGLSQTLEIDGEQFTVGVGHALVDFVARSTLGNLTVNATNTASKYIFLSSGFDEVSRQGHNFELQRNPPTPMHRR